MINFGNIEENIYRHQLEEGCQKLKKCLEAMDLLIRKEVGKEFVFIRNDERVLMTSCGPVRFKRSYFRSKFSGEYFHFLDQVLGLPKRDQISPFLQKMILSLSAEWPYRKCSAYLENYHMANISHGSIWNEVQETGNQLDNQEKSEREKVFRYGQQASRHGERKSPELFIEADGLHIPYQGRDRKLKKSGEIKFGYCYDERGVDPSSGGKETRYKLEEKRYFSGICHGKEFWENIALRLEEKWDTASTDLFVIGGDGASWIRSGTGQFPNSLFQLDRFHFQRAISRTFGIQGKEKAELAGWLENKPNYEEARACFARFKAECKDEKKLKRICDLEIYLLSNLNHIQDYRKRIGREDLPPLGTCEGNIDKVLANRFKKRGMSWSKKGADRLSKVVCSLRNGEAFPPLSQAPETQQIFSEIIVRKILKKVKEVYQAPQGSVLELAMYRSELKEKFRRILQ